MVIINQANGQARPKFFYVFLVLDFIYCFIVIYFFVVIASKIAFNDQIEILQNHFDNYGNYYFLVKLINQIASSLATIFS